jgi:hypothetical protein
MLDRIEGIRRSFIKRQAEPTDTDDKLQHHDPEFFKKHKDKDKDNKDHWAEFEKDATDISVQSLIIFLEGLIHDNRPINNKDKKNIDPVMQKAMKAYGGQDSHIQKRYTYLNEDDQDYDIQTVQKLIVSFKELGEAGIKDIALQYDENGFLESLQKTVEKFQPLQ